MAVNPCLYVFSSTEGDTASLEFAVGKEHSKYKHTENAHIVSCLVGLPCDCQDKPRDCIQHSTRA